MAFRVDNQTVTRRHYLSGWRLHSSELGGSVKSTVSGVGEGGADLKGLGRKGDAHERRTVRSLKR